MKPYNIEFIGMSITIFGFGFLMFGLGRSDVKIVSLGLMIQLIGLAILSAYFKMEKEELEELQQKLNDWKKELEPSK